jgi:hypothetical protein
VSVRSPARRAVPGTRSRRSRPVRRASARVSPVRAGAALAALLSAAAIYGVGASSAFEYATLTLDAPLRFTPQAAVDAALAPARGANLFELSTSPLVASLRSIETVADARVDARLPGTLAVHITEREPIVAWRVGQRRFLVDAKGLLFGDLSDPPPTGAPVLPVVTDSRATSLSLTVGSTLDATDLDAAARLASLTPGSVGSAADSLAVSVDDLNGFTLRARPQGWVAVFGFYTPTLRRTDLIPGQTRLLRSLLANREATVDRVILADADDGTYVAKPAPKGSASPPPSASPGAAASAPAESAAPSSAP